MMSNIATDQPINRPPRRSAPQRRHRQASQPAQFYSLSLKEFNQLLAAAGNDALATELRQIAALVFYTGIRQRELRDLSWSDVDVEKRTIRVGSKSGKQRTLPFVREVLPSRLLLHHHSCRQL